MLINLIIKNTRTQSLLMIVSFVLYLYILRLSLDIIYFLTPIAVILLVLMFQIELRNLFGKLIIVQTNRFDYFTLFFSSFWIYYGLALVEKDSSKLIWGIVEFKLLYIVTGITLLFIKRDDYIILSRHYIKQYKSGFSKSSKIKILWNKVLDVEINDDSLIIVSYAERMEIEKNSLDRKDISLIVELIYSKIDNSKIKENKTMDILG